MKDKIYEEIISPLICNIRQGHVGLRLPPESLNEMWVCTDITGPDTIDTANEMWVCIDITGPDTIDTANVFQPTISRQPRNLKTSTWATCKNNLAYSCALVGFMSFHACRQHY